MFTGLIETVGELAEIRPIETGFRLRVLTDIAADLHVGDSVAVNGVCLTVVDSSPTDWSAEVGPETAKVTSLGSLRPGALINLERAMPADGRFGGHIVLGHVDGVGAIQSIRPESDFYWVTVTCPGGLTPYVIHRGSIAVDGISLTVAGLSSSTFDVQIVPFTWTNTNLHGARVGDRVNLECDMVGKYVVRAVELYLEQRVVSGLSRTVGKA